MIRIYTGILGAGKTVGMVHDARDVVKSSLAQVYTDMRTLKFPGSMYFDVDDLDAIVHLSSGLIVLDEGQLMFSSRFWQQVPKATLSALAQLRKNGLDMYVTTQHIDRIDATLRAIVSEHVQVRHLVGRVYLHSVSVPGVKGVVRREVKRISPTTYSLYDSWEVLGRVKPEGTQPGAWLERVRESRAAKQPRRPRAIKRDPWLVRPSTLYVYKDNVRVMRPDAVAVMHSLDTANRLPPPGEERLQVIATELRRRYWLLEFGLRGCDVPRYITPDHPWERGCCPCCGHDRIAAIEDVQAAPMGRTRFAARSRR